MSRVCPLCSQQPLNAIQAGDVAIDLCPRCEGMWFDAGELELFPQRPSVKAFLARARLAPGRCRKQGHAVARSLVQCEACHGELVLCPVCRGRLAMVVAGRCVIDVCFHCEGVWLDKGELEALEGVDGTAPSAAKKGWEVPAATDDLGADPWRGAGESQPLSGPRVSNDPFACRHCGTVSPVSEAFAFRGDIYCANCRPAGSAAGASLPRDRSWADPHGTASAFESPSFQILKTVLRFLKGSR